MKNLLEFILINLVDHPDNIRIEELEQNGEWIYTIFVHPNDTGRIIGRGGSVISAIRQIATIRAMKEHQRIRVVVGEE